MKLTALTALIHQLADHRVVTAHDLRMGGADRQSIHRARNSEVLQVVPGVTGVYVVGPEPADDLTRMHVAKRYAGPGAVISGIWTARVLELPWVPETGPCLVRISADQRRRDCIGFVTICRTVRMEGIGTFQQDGLTFTTEPYAVVDACRQVQADRGRTPLLQLRDVRGLVLGAIANNRCTIEDLEAVLAHGSTRHTADTRRALVDARRGAASPPEAEVVDDLLAYGVPFYCNVEVWVGDALVAVLDVYLVGTGVGGELDSKQEHEDEPRLDATLTRHETVEGFGFDLRHVTPTRYRENPQRFLAGLFEAARARLAEGKGDPPGVRLVPRGPLLCGPQSDLTPYLLPATPLAA